MAESIVVEAPDCHVRATGEPTRMTLRAGTEPSAFPFSDPDTARRASLGGHGSPAAGKKQPVKFKFWCRVVFDERCLLD